MKKNLLFVFLFAGIFGFGVFLQSTPAEARQSIDVQRSRYIDQSEHLNYLLDVRINNVIRRFCQRTNRFFVIDACLQIPEPPQLPVSEFICGDGMINQINEQCDGTTGVPHGFECTNECQLQEIQDTPPSLPPPPPTSGAARVVINEVYYDVAAERGASNNEWLELYNAGDVAINIGDWVISDNVSSDALPEGLILEAGAFLVISANETTFTEFWQSEIPDTAQTLILGGSIGNGMGASGDVLVLTNTDGVEIDRMSYGSNIDGFDPAAPDVDKGHSLSRSPNGSDSDQAIDWTDLESPSPGA